MAYFVEDISAWMDADRPSGEGYICDFIDADTNGCDTTDSFSCFDTPFLDPTKTRADDFD